MPALHFKVNVPSVRICRSVESLKSVYTAGVTVITGAVQHYISTVSLLKDLIPAVEVCWSVGGFDLWVLLNYR